MLHYIERLRQKPERARRRYAFAISFFIVIIIAGVWAANRFYFLSAPQGSQNAVADNPSPVQSILKTFSDGYANVRSAIKNITPSAKPDTPPNLIGEAEKDSTTTPSKFGEVVITDPVN